MFSSFFRSKSTSGDGFTPEVSDSLKNSIEGGQVNVVKKILKKNPKIVNHPVEDASLQTPLIIAVIHSKFPIIQYLLTLPELLVNLTDRSGWTALHYAVFQGDYEIVQLLLAHPQVSLKPVEGLDEVTLTPFDLICGMEGCDVTQSEAISNLLRIQLSKEKVELEVVDRLSQELIKYDDNLDLLIQDTLQVQAKEEVCPERIYSYDMNNYEADIRYCLEHQDELHINHYNIAVFGERQSGKTSFIQNLSHQHGINGSSNNGISLNTLPKFAIESFELDLVYTINHHYESRLWLQNHHPPERRLEWSLATWIYENNFIHDSPRIQTILSTATSGKPRGLSRSGSSFYRRSSFRNSPELNPALLLAVTEEEIRHDIVKKYLLQQYHVQQPRLSLTIHDYQAKHLYKNLYPIFHLPYFYTINCVVFDMEKLLTVSSRPESIQQIRYWIQQILLRQNTVDTTTDANIPIGSKTSELPYYLLFIGTHKDMIPKLTDHIKLSNLLYEKLQDLPIWDHIITNPYISYENHQLIFSPAETITAQENLGRFSPITTDDDDNEEEGEGHGVGRKSTRYRSRRGKNSSGLDLWFYPITNIHDLHSQSTAETPTEDPAFLILRNEIEDCLLSLSRQQQKKKRLTRDSSLIVLNQYLPSLSSAFSSVNTGFSSSFPRVELSILKYFQFIDQLYSESNPFLTLESFQSLLFSQNYLNPVTLTSPLTALRQENDWPLVEDKLPITAGPSMNTLLTDKTYRYVLSLLFLQLLSERGMIYWSSHGITDSLSQVIIIKPLEYFLKPLNYVIYEHTSINLEVSGDLFPSHELSKSRYPSEWQQMIKYGILTHDLLQSLLLPYEYYSHQLIYMMIKLHFLTPITILSGNGNADTDTDNNIGESQTKSSIQYYLLPVFFPKISLSNHYQVYSPRLTCYYYFEACKGNQPIMSSRPPVSNNGILLGSDCFTWADLKRRGCMPSGLFSALLTQMIEYSQQTSHDLYLKFSAKAPTSEGTPFSSRQSSPTARKPSNTTTTTTATTSVTVISKAEQEELELLERSNNDRVIQLHAYHHCFYHNQMILQFGDWRVRLTYHHDYHVIQVEVESILAFPMIHAKLWQWIHELLGLFYPQSGLSCRCLFSSMPSPSLTEDESVETLQKKQEDLAAIKSFELMLPNEKKRNVFLVDYQLLADFRNFSFVTPSAFSHPMREDFLGSSYLDDSLQSGGMMRRQSSLSVSSPRRNSLSITSPRRSQSLLLSPHSNPLLNLATANAPVSNSLVLQQHYETFFHQMIAKYEGFFTTIQQLQQERQQYHPHCDLYFSYWYRSPLLSLATTLETMSTLTEVNSLSLVDQLVEGMIFRLRLYSIHDPLEANDDKDYKDKRLLKKTRRNIITRTSAVELVSTEDDEESHRLSRNEKEEVEILRVKQIFASSLFVPIIVKSMIRLFQLLSTDNNPEKENNNQTGEEPKVSSVASQLFSPVRKSEERVDDLSSLLSTSKRHLLEETDGIESLAVIEQCLLEWIAARYVMLWYQRRHQRRRHSFSSRIRSQCIGKKGLIEIRLQQIIPVLIGTIQENHRDRQQIIFRFDKITREEITTKISSKLMPKQVLQRFQAILTSLSLPLIPPEEYTYYSINSLLLFFHEECLGRPSDSFVTSTPSPSSFLPSSSLSLVSWQWMQAYDYSIAFSMKIIETILIKLREIRILQEEEEATRQVRRSRREGREDSSDSDSDSETDATNSSRQKITRSGNNDEEEENEGEGDNRYLYQTPVKRKSMFGGRNQLIYQNKDHYYYQQYLSPKRSPYRFLPHVVPTVSGKSSSLSLSPVLTEGSPSILASPPLLAPLEVSLSSPEVASQESRHQTFLEAQEGVFIQQLCQYFQEIQLLRMNHNYVMNYYLFQQKPGHQITASNSPNPSIRKGEQFNTVHTQQLEEAEEEAAERRRLLKQYYQEIKHTSRITPSSAASSVLTSHGSYLILYETIQEYYHRVLEIYYELSHQYEIPLELLLCQHRGLPHSSSTDITIRQGRGEQEKEERESPEEVEMKRSLEYRQQIRRIVNGELTWSEIDSYRVLYRLYLEYFEKKRSLQSMIREILLIYPIATKNGKQLKGSSSLL